MHPDSEGGTFRKLPSEGTHLVVLVIDAEPLPQVSEHHGTVLFKLKATRQVFSDNKERQRVTQGQHDTQQPRGLVTEERGRRRSSSSADCCIYFLYCTDTYKFSWCQPAARSRANFNIRLFNNTLFQFSITKKTSFTTCERRRRRFHSAVRCFKCSIISSS